MQTNKTISLLEKSKNLKKTLPPLSNTPVPISSLRLKSLPKASIQDKTDFELELKSKHRILKSMVRTEKHGSSSQDNSALNFSFKRMSAGMKIIGKYRNEEALVGQVLENLHTRDKFSLRINDSDREARQKYLKNEHNIWASKRGKKQIKQERSFSDFLQDFFDCLESTKTELIKLNDLIIPLLTYGVASESNYIERAIKVTFETDDLINTQVTKKCFVEKLKEDIFFAQIMKSLQISAKSYFGTVNESFPSIYYSFDTFFILIKDWWGSISASCPLVHSSKIAHFLASVPLIQGYNNSVKYCQLINQEEFFSLQSFERLFLKPVLIAQIKNIAHGISLEKSDLPLSLKLALYQRRLLIAGVKSNNNDKSRASLQGAYKFSKKNLSEASSSQLRQKVENEETANKLKIKQVIYEADQEGCKFVDENGELIEGISNTWDVTNAIGEGNKVSKSYLEVFKSDVREMPPYSRNVKIFRDNFLFEKFQKVTGSTAGL